MPFSIVRNDITRMKADAIVNTANPRPVVGAGTDAAVHRAAGPDLLEARRAIGDIPVGRTAVTPGFGLPARYVIHAVGPVWQGGEAGEEALLRQCYDSALARAAELGCASVAFPLLSAGIYGFPRDRALRVAESAFRAFLADHEMMIWLVVFDKGSFAVSEVLFRAVESFLDETYVEEKLKEEYRGSRRERGAFRPFRSPRREEAARRQEAEREAVLSDSVILSSAPAAPGIPIGPEEGKLPPLGAAGAGEEDLNAWLRQMDRGFSETLLALIDASGETDAAVYKRANVDRKLFSKIRSNPDYRPSKPTALAFAFALGLDLEGTRDLLARAGYALSHSSKFDLIVEYFLSRGVYDLFQVNEILFSFDQPLIGA